MFNGNSRNSENITLPKTVRTLPNTVRFQNQGNTLFSDQIYQGTTKKNINILDIEFWEDYEGYLKNLIGKVVYDAGCFMQNNIIMLLQKKMHNRFLYYLIIRNYR